MIDFEAGCYSVAQGVAIMAHCSLKCLGSSDPPALAFPVVGTTGRCHQGWLIFLLLLFCFVVVVRDGSLLPRPFVLFLNEILQSLQTNEMDFFLFILSAISCCSSNLLELVTLKFFSASHLDCIPTVTV